MVNNIEDFEQLPVKVTHVGLVTSPFGDLRNQMDHWNIEFKKGSNVWVADYYTGVGHRKKLVGFKASKHRDAQFLKGEWVVFVPVPPKIAGVMYSLLMGATAMNESFNDWCDNYGYSSDSFKAFDTYQKCCDIGKNLNKFFTHAEMQKMRDLLQDY